jgi:hypothetical protein
VSRTTADLVKGVLMDDYGARLDGTPPDLSPYIDTASLLVDRVVTCAAGKRLALTAAELELIERWLSAHAYAMVDQPYASKSTGGASGSYQGRTDMMLEATKYGQMALALDWTGCLSAVSKQARAGARWLGKPPRDQLSYDDRS